MSLAEQINSLLSDEDMLSFLGDQIFDSLRATNELGVQNPSVSSSTDLLSLIQVAPLVETLLQASGRSAGFQCVFGTVCRHGKGSDGLGRAGFVNLLRESLGDIVVVAAREEKKEAEEIAQGTQDVKMQEPVRSVLENAKPENLSEKESSIRSSSHAVSRILAEALNGSPGAFFSTDAFMGATPPRKASVEKRTHSVVEVERAVVEVERVDKRALTLIPTPIPDSMKRVDGKQNEKPHPIERLLVTQDSAEESKTRDNSYPEKAKIEVQPTPSIPRPAQTVKPKSPVPRKRSEKLEPKEEIITLKKPPSHPFQKFRGRTAGLSRAAAEETVLEIVAACQGAVFEDPDFGAELDSLKLDKLDLKVAPAVKWQRISETGGTHKS